MCGEATSTQDGDRESQDHYGAEARVEPSTMQNKELCRRVITCPTRVHLGTNSKAKRWKRDAKQDRDKGYLNQGMGPRR